MGKAWNARYKVRRRKDAAARINYDNVKFYQQAAHDAERGKFVAPIKRLLKGVRRDG